MSNEYFFLRVATDLAKSRAEKSEVDTLYSFLREDSAGTDLNKFFKETSATTLQKAVAIDNVAHQIYCDGDSALQKLWPGADFELVQKELIELADCGTTCEIRKFNQGYYTPLFDDSAFTFLEKSAVGEIERGGDISVAIEEYERLHKAQLASDAEILTLARYYKDDPSKPFADIAKKRGLEGDNTPMVVGGPASVVMEDKQHHLITSDALLKAFKDFMKNPRTRNIQILHTNVQTGWPLPAYINKDGQVFKSGVDKTGLWLISEIRSDMTIAKKVQSEIESGRIKSYSIAGTATETQTVHKGMDTIMQVDALELAEVTLCQEGVNQGANFDIIKAVMPDKEVVADDIFVVKAFDIANYGVVLEKSKIPVVVINAEQENIFTDMMQLQLRKFIPETVSIEVRATPYAAWVPLMAFKAIPINDGVDNESTIDLAVSLKKSKETQQAKSSLGSESEVNSPSIFSKAGDKMGKVSKTEELMDWVDQEKNRRKQHRKFMDGQGIPEDKKFETNNLDTSRYDMEVKVSELKPSDQISNTSSG